MIAVNFIRYHSGELWKVTKCLRDEYEDDYKESPESSKKVKPAEDPLKESAEGISSRPLLFLYVILLFIIATRTASTGIHFRGSATFNGGPLANSTTSKSVSAQSYFRITPSYYPPHSVLSFLSV